MGFQSGLERAKSMIYGNARLLDRKRYAYFFEGGSREEVIEALRAYQNPDGGFGNALEPDIRCPFSQPVPTEMALAIMDQIGCFDLRMVEGINRYLRDVTLEEGGLPLALRSVNDYPHAPWWNTIAEDRPSINPTGTIIGLLYKQNVLPDIVDEPHFAKSVEFIWRFMERERPAGYHDGIHWVTFLQHTPDRERAAAYWPIVEEWLGRPGTIEKRPNAEGYVHKVLDWAPDRESYARKFVSDEELNGHLRALADQQQEDGGWPLSWKAVSPAGEQEWRGHITVERLRTLKSFGHL